MLRSKSFHKSMPNIRASSARPPSSTLTSSNSSKLIIGRDELEERYLDLRDRHLGLKKEATSAQEELRLLHVKLNRLIDEKKRYFRHRKSDREVALEETIYDLEQQLGRQARANDKLRDRMQLMKYTGSEGEEVKGHFRSQALVLKKPPYSHVQPRVDSGLGPPTRGTSPVFSFRPKSGGILKNTSGEPQTKLPLTATLLMREAKEEIIRLEEIVAEQQMMLDTLLCADGVDEENHNFQNKLPQNRSSNFSYQLTTTTTATASLTASGASMSTANGFGHHHELQNGSSGDGSNSPAVVDLYNKYQQLVMRQESAQKLSTDVRTLIESLYRSLREEKSKVADLRAKLAAKDELNLVITEKDTQIEALRRENTLLQQSLADCIAQCMSFNSGHQGGNSPKQTPVEANSQIVLAENTSASSRYLEALKSAFEARSEAAQKEVAELSGKLAETEVQLNSEKTRYCSLQAQFDALQQLSESDALHVGHLQAKIDRLTALLFPVDKENTALQIGRSKSAVNGKSVSKTKINSDFSHLVEEKKESLVKLEPFNKNEDVQNLNFKETFSSSSSTTSFDNELPLIENEDNKTFTEKLDQLLNSLQPTVLNDQVLNENIEVEK